MSRFYNRIVVANYHSKCSFCWQKTIKKRSHFGLFVHQGFTVYRASGADVKGEPSFLALYAYAKENK